MLNVLLVQQDGIELAALRESFQRAGRGWEVDGGVHGKDLLETIGKKPADVVILHGHAMDSAGTPLAASLKRDFPNVVRIVVARDRAEEFALRSSVSAHQFLSLPVSSSALIQAIGRACSLRDFIRSKNVLKVVSKVKRLPTIPDNYRQINALLERDDITMEDVSKVIRKDVAMMAKILQLANSAVVSGRRKPVSTVESGVKMLGVANLKMLVLAVEVFSQFDVRTTEYFNLDVLWEHSMRVENLCLQIAKSLSSDREFMNDALAAGMLHDVGKLVLVRHFPDEVNRVVSLVKEKGLTLYEAELEVFGASHAEVGGYLLGSWGLPHSIVEAVAYHHAPMSCFKKDICPLTAVYFANVIEHIQFGQPNAGETESCKQYVKALGLEEQFTNWCALTPAAE